MGGWAVTGPMVWSAFFSSGDQGFEVLLDYVDGTVLGSIEYILN